jgi:glycosyltransferase involved in cell wall biosynthesis
MFSIITPTHNRAKKLPRVYNSLKSQTFTDFEWVIADDGSTDETEALVREWQINEKSFNIIYHKQVLNQGKSYAVNKGLTLCKRPYTLIADSDDTFAKNTLEDLKSIWESVERTNENKNIGAIWTLVEDENGHLVGEAFPKNLWQVDFKERVLDRNVPIAGEKWHCWRTVVLNEFKMFVNPNSFISEAATWNTINTRYDFLCVNVVHRRYWFSQDGLIHQKKSYKDIQKVIYYTSYYNLKKSKISEILKSSHYRNIAFNFIRASFYYKDTELRLTGVKLYISWIAFLSLLPNKVISKLLTT